MRPRSGDAEALASAMGVTIVVVESPIGKLLVVLVGIVPIVIAEPFDALKEEVLFASGPTVDATTNGLIVGDAIGARVAIVGTKSGGGNVSAGCRLVDVVVPLVAFVSKTLGVVKLKGDGHNVAKS